ncbi:hypothetical protein KEM56_005236 [Ascosphaera pollenicola]|nr:hypothetical protein KEM56_005236 [Ascosphaera pollenicola]
MISNSDGESAKAIEAPVLTMSGWRLYIIQFCLLFCLTLSVMDSSAVSTALMSIGDHFNNTMNIQWVVLSYILSDLGFAMVFSRISDILGRKWTIILALVFITAFSLGCGCAQTLNQLIAFRTLQGLGGAGLYSVPLIVLPEITPVKQFRILGALIGIAVTVSAVVGPTLGGVIVTHSTWRWVFWFNVPCGGFIIILMLIFCPNFDTFGKIKWTQLDLLGCALYIAVSFLPIYALQQAGAGTVSGLVGYSFYTVLVELPERFQLVNGKSAEMSGIYLLAVSGASAVGSGVGPSLSMKRNNTVPTVTAGCAILLVGLGLMYTINGDQEVAPKLYGFEVIVGFGLGLVISTTTVMIKLSASIEDAAAAQGLMSQSRLFGGNFGLAIATVVLNRHLSHDLKGTVPDDEIDTVRHSLLAVKKMNPFQQLAVRNSFVSSFRTDIMICMIVTGVAVLFCVLTWERHPATVQDKLVEAGILPAPEDQPTDRTVPDYSTSTLHTVGDHAMQPIDKTIEPGSAGNNAVPPFVRQPARSANASQRSRMTDGDWFPDLGRPYRNMPPITE